MASQWPPETDDKIPPLPLLPDAPPPPPPRAPSRRSSSGRGSHQGTLHSCYICTKKFKQVCTKTFTQSGHLNNHMRLHTGGRPHACPVCQKRFTQTGHLSNHMRMHTGERPYDCLICDKAFAQSGHLASHLRSHQGLTLGASSTSCTGRLGGIPPPPRPAPHIIKLTPAGQEEEQEQQDEKKKPKEEQQEEQPQQMLPDLSKNEPSDDTQHSGGWNPSGRSTGIQMACRASVALPQESMPILEPALASMIDKQQAGMPSNVPNDVVVVETHASLPHKMQVEAPKVPRQHGRLAMQPREVANMQARMEMAMRANIPAEMQNRVQAELDPHLGCPLDLTQDLRYHLESDPPLYPRYNSDTDSDDSDDSVTVTDPQTLYDMMSMSSTSLGT
ncbi:hypothetical protein HPB51_013719 [Rhipicephalus microplus]|uniref:C2H2-type domain-containing protein n=1 Tax=Rhipicephalus microplus TaxID=6941 RepID=A0A9J6F319_RHIMP|nr:hypothetical protein HPB51_013719 [Rhipicephalus microplus]